MSPVGHLRGAGCARLRRTLGKQAGLSLQKSEGHLRNQDLQKNCPKDKQNSNTRRGWQTYPTTQGPEPLFRRGALVRLSYSLAFSECRGRVWHSPHFLRKPSTIIVMMQLFLASESYNYAFLLSIEVFCLQWESPSNKHSTNYKQKKLQL